MLTNKIHIVGPPGASAVATAGLVAMLVVKTLAVGVGPALLPILDPKNVVAFVLG